MENSSEFWRVWVFGILIVTFINLCALFGVVINPLSKKPWYRGLLLFLVSLAVGVLSGSSLLFLFAGALKIDEDEDRYAEYIFSVSLVLLSVFMFFNFEHLLKLFLAYLTARRRKGCDKKESPRSTKKLADPMLQCDTGTGQSVVDGDIDMEDLPVMTISHHHPHTAISQATCLSVELDEEEDEVTSKSPVNIESKKNGDMQNKLRNVVSPTRSEKSEVSFLSSFSHVQPVAWMVIFGDGIHNFVDGLTIGAAMNQGYAEGLSISIAVLAEELPHEIGDLAVLLRAGLSIRRALVLNFLSACLCYAGYVVGAFLGELPDAQAIIFALAGGLFLYISLTDLLPEISPDSHGHGHSHDAGNESANKRPESSASGRVYSIKKMVIHLVIANSGMLIGYLSMLMLAYYAGDVEEWVKKIVESHVQIDLQVDSSFGNTTISTTNGTQID